MSELCGKYGVTLFKVEQEGSEFNVYIRDRNSTLRGATYTQEEFLSLVRIINEFADEAEYE